MSNGGRGAQFDDDLTWARIWLNGYSSGVKKHTLRRGSDDDVRGRQALCALLLMDRPPKDILDSLARLFAPPSADEFVRYGSDLVRPEGHSGQALLLGSEWMLGMPVKRHKRTDLDGYTVGRILTGIKAKIDEGTTLEAACDELSDELSAEVLGLKSKEDTEDVDSVRGLSARNLKDIWQKSKDIRSMLWPAD